MSTLSRDSDRPMLTFVPSSDRIYDAEHQRRLHLHLCLWHASESEEQWLGHRKQRLGRGPAAFGTGSRTKALCQQQVPHKLG